MVIPLLDPTVCAATAARRVLRGFGVDDAAFAQRGIDRWIEFEAELDRFTAYGFGAATQRRFLHAPHLYLDGSTPAEMLASDGGFDAALVALRRSLANLEADTHA